jgi:hypothetical protein
MKKKAILLMLALMFISTNALSQNIIQGKITGDVQAGITVNVYVLTCGAPQPFAALTTDAQGDYATGNIANGRYLVVPESTVYSFAPEGSWVDIPQAESHPYDFISTDDPGLQYQLAAKLDESLLVNAQTMTAHIEAEDIEVLGTNFPDFGVFESNFAQINAANKTVSPISIFFEEDMSAYPNAPDTINGAFVTKMISKDKIESYFDINIDGEQGTCSDIQEFIYDNVLNTLLIWEQQIRYWTEGKSLTFLPELTNNPAWVSIDPASLITQEGDDYFFQPLSLYLSINTTVEIDELLKGTKYCKLLSHQAILSWLLEKSFEDNPVLLTPDDTCYEPSSFEAQGGSCIFYFRQAQSYYCSDYTGSFFDNETGAAKCQDRLDTSGGLGVLYSTSPCSERTVEIEAYLPASEYVGFTGLCVIHCQEENELLWNIYTENPEASCVGWDFFTPEAIDAMK